MDRDGITLSEISQQQKDKHCMLSFSSGIYKMKETNITKQKQAYTIKEQTVVTRVKRGKQGQDRGIQPLTFSLSVCEWDNAGFFFHFMGFLFLSHMVSQG